MTSPAQRRPGTGGAGTEYTPGGGDPSTVEARVAALEARVAELWAHCVVLERLHGTLDHAEVLAGIQDCVINILGSEELAVYEPAPDGTLRPVQCFGVEGRGLSPVRAGQGPAGRAAADGRGWVTGDGPPPSDAPDLTACVPLAAGGRLEGVLAFWRLLPHRPPFSAADREVLELLASHAGTALHLTRRTA